MWEHRQAHFQGALGLSGLELLGLHGFRFLLERNDFGAARTSQ